MQIVVEETDTIPRNMDSGKIPRIYPELRQPVLDESQEEPLDIVEIFDKEESAKLEREYRLLQQELARQELEVQEERERQENEAKIRALEDVPRFLDLKRVLRGPLSY